MGIETEYGISSISSRRKTVSYRSPFLGPEATSSSSDFERDEACYKTVKLQGLAHNHDRPCQSMEEESRVLVEFKSSKLEREAVSKGCIKKKKNRLLINYWVQITSIIIIFSERITRFPSDATSSGLKPLRITVFSIMNL